MKLKDISDNNLRALLKQTPKEMWTEAFFKYEKIKNRKDIKNVVAFTMTCMRNFRIDQSRKKDNQNISLSSIQEKGVQFKGQDGRNFDKIVEAKDKLKDISQYDSLYKKENKKIKEYAEHLSDEKVLERKWFKDKLAGKETPVKETVKREERKISKDGMEKELF